MSEFGKQIRIVLEQEVSQVIIENNRRKAKNQPTGGSKSNST